MYKHVPKYLEVRFRYTVLLSSGLKRMIQVFMSISKRLLINILPPTFCPRENEATVIQIYLGDYINTRLCRQFLIEAGQPFLKLHSVL